MLPSWLAAVAVLVFGDLVRALRLRKFSARPTKDAEEGRGALR
jgi:hypothetical protein